MANDLRTKRIKDWANLATRAMLKVGNFLALDGPDGTFKIPAESPLKTSIYNSILLFSKLHELISSKNFVFNLSLL